MIAAFVIGGGSLIQTLIYLVVFVIVVSLAWWILGQVTLPEPLAKWVRILFVVICVIFLISVILSFAGCTQFRESIDTVGLTGYSKNEEGFEAGGRLEVKIREPRLAMVDSKKMLGDGKTMLGK